MIFWNRLCLRLFPRKPTPKPKKAQVIESSSEEEMTVKSDEADEESSEEEEVKPRARPARGGGRARKPVKYNLDSTVDDDEESEEEEEDEESDFEMID